MRKITLTLALFATFFLAITPVSADDRLRVYYAGEQDSVRTALEIAGVYFVDDLLQADVFVLNDEIPEIAIVHERLKAGAGLVLLLGPNIEQDSLQELMEQPINITIIDTPLSLTSAATPDPLTAEVVWNSAPQVRDRYQIAGGEFNQLAIGYEDDTLVLGYASLGQGVIFIFTPFLGKSNPQIQEWMYFNYLVYHLTMRAAKQLPLAFSEYHGSPVPHASERNLILILLGIMLATTFVVFTLVRRYSKKHPEELESIVGNRTRFETLEASTRWEEVGYHRPLSGFLVALCLGLVLFIPLIIYQNLILPVFILPSAQALGIWGRVMQFFTLAWQFFDLGTSVAFIKFLAQHRVHDPKKGIQYGQLFIWWQALSGAVQVALVIALASTIVPRLAYALYAWSVIVHALIQIPGFYQVFRHAFNGFQRLDYSRLLDVVVTMMPMVVQPLCVSLMYAWGRSHPIFGGAMGGLLGMGLAAYAAELLTFIIGFWLYKRIGFNIRVLFLAHFDWEVVKNSFRFGVFEMLGSIAWAAGQATEIWITQARLINFTEIWGNWVLAQNFIYAFQVIGSLFDGAMASISEAISHGKRILSQYYSAMCYKYGGGMSAFLCSVLLAVADRFILGASGPEFVRAARYVIPLAIWGAIQYPSWVGDQVQLGSNLPYLKSLLVFSEQVLRIILALVLLERFQINALIIAYFIALLSKDIVAYFVNQRTCFPQRFYFWQSLGAPLLAGATHCAFLRWITGYLWQSDQITSVLIFFIGVLPSFPIFMFFYGIFGGWDDDTLAELKQAAELTGFVRPLAWLAWAPSMLGARLSPLHNRFPITNRDVAMLEAQQLTEEKVKL